MTKYPVSPKVKGDLNPSKLQALMTEVFGTCSAEGETLHASFGALKDLKVSVDGKQLLVETVMDPKVPPDVQSDTIKRYYSFLERATGYTAKERAKRLQQAAKKGTAEG
jgi:hypothetical protein